MLHIYPQRPLCISVVTPLHVKSFPLSFISDFPSPPHPTSLLYSFHLYASPLCDSLTSFPHLIKVHPLSTIFL